MFNERVLEISKQLSLLPCATATISTLQRPPLPRLAIEALSLPSLNDQFKLEQVQELVECRMPKLSTMNIGRLEKDAAHWLRENHSNLEIAA